MRGIVSWSLQKYVRGRTRGLQCILLYSIFLTRRCECGVKEHKHACRRRTPQLLQHQRSASVASMCLIFYGIVHLVLFLQGFI